jgi:hypothetical protein
VFICLNTRQPQNMITLYPINTLSSSAMHINYVLFDQLHFFFLSKIPDMIQKIMLSLQKIKTDGVENCYTSIKKIILSIYSWFFSTRTMFKVQNKWKGRIQRNHMSTPDMYKIIKQITIFFCFLLFFFLPTFTFYIFLWFFQLFSAI